MTTPLYAENVFSRHSSYMDLRSQAMFLLDAYRGTGGFDDGTYLDHHQREVRTDTVGTVLEEYQKFKDRKARCYYPNIIKTVVNVPVSYIYQAPITRDGHDKYKEFRDDCTGRGTHINTMFEELSRYARIFGVMFFVVDRPASDKAVEDMTKADDDDPALRPRLIPVFPYDIVDYHISDGRLRWAKILERYEESDDPMEAKKCGYRIRLWTETEWSLYDVETIDQMTPNRYSTALKASLTIPVPKEPGDKTRRSRKPTATRIGGGPHKLGRVPLIGVYNEEPEFNDLFGTTDIFQSARVARRLFNLCSELDEIIRDQTFSIFIVPTDNTDDTQDQVVGTQNAVYVKVNSGGMMPAFVAPPDGPAMVIRNEINEHRTEIYRAASMQYAEGAVNVRSGVAKQWNFDQTNRFLAGLAKRGETAEKAAGELALLWRGVTPKEGDVKVQYPSQFNVADMMSEIEQADAIITMRLSKTFNQKVAEDLVAKRFPNLSKDERDKIVKEIAESEFIDPPPMPMEGGALNLAARAGLRSRVKQKKGQALAQSTAAAGQKEQPEEVEKK
jgi:hypothetical protein